jgi:hypothetical protein
MLFLRIIASLELTHGADCNTCSLVSAVILILVLKLKMIPNSSGFSFDFFSSEFDAFEVVRLVLIFFFLNF